MTDVAEFCSGIQVGIQGFTAKQIWDSGRDSGIHLRSKFGIQVGIQGFTAKQLWDSGIQVMGFRDSGNYKKQRFRDSGINDNSFWCA